MKNRQDLIISLLEEKIKTTKVGIIVNGIDGIDPTAIVKMLGVNHGHKLYAVSVGYASVSPLDTTEYSISTQIENAVTLRNDFQCAGHIIVFISGDIDRLHSLNVFDVINKRDLTQFAIELQCRAYKSDNKPIREFWDALLATSEYYSLSQVEEFIESIEVSADKGAAISQNLWKLNLLCDEKILSASVDRKQRLIDNRNKITDIAQITEGSRKNLSKSLARASATQKAALQRAYRLVETYSQYGTRETLKDLDFTIVSELLSATVSKKPKKKVVTPPVNPVSPENPSPDTPEEPDPPKEKILRQKDIDAIIADQLLFGDDSGHKDIEDVYSQVKAHYADESSKRISLPSVSGIFQDQTIDIDKPQDNLRKLVGANCSATNWGGILRVKETVLKDAIGSSATPLPFSPSLLKYSKDKSSLYDVIKEFDSCCKFDESLQTVLDLIITKRSELIKYLDVLMYNPLMMIEADKEAVDILKEYIEAWSKMYSLINKYKNSMSAVGSDKAQFVGRALLALDVLYVNTGDGKWKGMLMPLHPFYLWGYYEIAKTLSNDKEGLDPRELTDLKSVLLAPPQLLNYLAVDEGVTGTHSIILPCSGSIQMLPTFENSTNRFLGDDGIDSIPDTLDRWLGYAPFTKHEIRICLVDTPNLAAVVRKIAAFMEKNSVSRMVCDVFYTHGQNGNTELASLDYSDRDYSIGELIKNGRLILSIQEKKLSSVPTALSKHPVHVVFFFDQSSYTVKEADDIGKLTSNPFVVTYDFKYEKMDHAGSLSPSARSQTGIVGDYHDLMVTSSYITKDKSPWLCVDPTDNMDVLLSCVKNEYSQWMVIADRNIGNYQIKDEHGLIPIGEKVYNRRRVGIWASKTSRIISQYKKDLMEYSLNPDEDTLVKMIKEYGHIASTGLISIPKASFDANVTKSRQKGLLGTLFAATWYANRSCSEDESVMVASLDTEKARVWLTARDEASADTDKKLGQERADLIGLRYDRKTDTLYLQPIEVKTRDEDSESQRDYELFCDEYGTNKLRGHAPEQVAAIIRILSSIFEGDSSVPINFISARREVLKYQIITECFRNIHDTKWQEEWHGVLSRAFEKEEREGLNIVISGILAYIRLGDATAKDSEPVLCKYDDAREYPIELSVLTSHDIQKQVFMSDSSADSTSPVAKEEPCEHESDETELPQSTANPIEETTEAVSLPDVETSPVQKGQSGIISADAVTEVQVVPAEVIVETPHEHVDLQNVRFLLGEDLRSKEKFYWEFGNKKLNNRHLLINGNSGCGKTYCIESLLLEAAAQGISSVVFDYTGGFTTKKLEPVFKEKLGDKIKQRVVRVSKIPINPFERHELEIDDDVFVPETDVDIASKIAETVASVYKMGDQQKNSVYTATLSGLKTHGSLMNFRYLADEMEADGSSYAKTALGRLQQFIDIDPFVTGEEFNWSSIRDSGGTVYIFQFMGYSRDVQVMLTELLLWDLWSYGLKNGSEDKPFIYVIDEAQNLSHGEKSPSGMLLTEGRKYGLSGWYATQFMKPQLSDDEIQRLQQADQKLYFCPPGEGVMTVAKNIDIASQGTKEWAERLQKLNKGECVTCGSMIRGGKWNKYDPRVIKISSLEERLK